jgi:hypothetical protein
MLSPGVRRNQGPWLRLGGSPAWAPARLTSGGAAVWCCAQSSTWLAARVSWPPGPGCATGRLTGPDARRSAPGRARQPAGPGGWKREGPGRPVDNGERARCRRDGLRSEGMPGPSSLACLEYRPGPPRRATGHRMGAAAGPAAAAIRDARRPCSVNNGANLAMPYGARAPMTPRDGSLQGSRARVAATPRGIQGKAGEVGWQQRSRDSSWPGGRHHAHLQRA